MSKTNNIIDPSFNWIPLDELSLKITDGSHNPPKKQNEGIPMISAKNILNGKISFKDVRYISLEDFKYEYQRANIECGDLLLTIVASIGRVAIVSNNIEQRFAIQRSIALIKPSKKINNRFLLYAIQAPFFQKELENKAKGTAQKGIYLDTLKNITVPLFVTDQQYQIVEIIEELFSELDKAEETIIKTKYKIDLCRRSILEHILFNKEATEDEYVCVGDVAEKISIKAYPSNTSEFKFIGLDSIEPNTTSISQVYEFKDFSSSGNYFEKGHILYSRMRPYLNKVYKADFNGVASGEYIVLECKDRIIDDYLKYILHSASFVNYANLRSIGDRPRVSFEDISRFRFYLGDLNKQRQRIDEIEYYFTIIDNLFKTIMEGENQIKILRQSLLKKAFDGKLITLVETKDSISSLLDQIKLEKIEYAKKQKQIARSQPKKRQKMKEKKTILEILQSANTPLLAEEVWLQSEHKNNIENFYTALKQIQNQIVATKKNAESFLAIKK